MAKTTTVVKHNAQNFARLQCLQVHATAPVKIGMPSVGHVLTHEDIVKLPRVAEEVEPVADKVECRVCEDEDLRLVPESSEIPLNGRS